MCRWPVPYADNPDVGWIFYSSVCVSHKWRPEYLKRIFRSSFMAWFFSTFTNTIRKSTHKKTPSPKLTFENSALLRLQGFEPWTNRLRVYCSTSWAKGACDMKYFNASSTILHRGWKINPQFEIFLIFYTIPSTVLFFVSFFVLLTGFADTFF